jgi:hypothetical protein
LQQIVKLLLGKIGEGSRLPPVTHDGVDLR